MYKSIREQSKKIFFFIKEKKGSAAIILSLMVSGAVLSTIYFSQNIVNWFASSQDRNMEDWEYAFVSQLALNTASYLISHNIILCKKKGWNGHNTLCKWNENSKWNSNGNTITPNDFNMTKKTYNENGKQIFSLVGTVDQKVKDIIDNPHYDIIKYRITFDLVSWKDNSIKSIVGDIPLSACRNMDDLTINREGICPESTACKDNNDQVIPDTMCELNKLGNVNICMNMKNKQIHTEGVCPQSTVCKDNNNKDIPDTRCESIASTDQDYSIVLVSVTTPLEKNNLMKKQVLAGIRRPLSMPLLKVLEEPVCKLSCPSSSTTSSLPECRGEFIPATGENNAKIKMRLLNPGPGAVYAISLLRKDRLLNPNIPEVVEYSATEELIGQAGKEVLLPGESIEFEDFVDCTESVNFEFAKKYTRDPALAGTSQVYTTVNPHATPFKQIIYSLFSLQNPIGVCMADDPDLNVKLPVKDATCPNEYKPDHSCKKGGKCYYSSIEPNRYMSNIAGIATKTTGTTTGTTTGAIGTTTGTTTGATTGTPGSPSNPDDPFPPFIDLPLKQQTVTTVIVELIPPH